MAIDEILEDIEETLDKAPTIPFVNHKKIVDGERMRELINDIRINLPHELKEAKKIEYDSERIIGDAKLNADAIIRKAEEKASQLVAKEPIVIEARKRADDIVRDAKERALEMIRRAQSSSAKLEKEAALSAAKMLSDAENLYNRNLTEVRAAKEKLQRELRTSPALTQNTPAVPAAEPAPDAAPSANTGRFRANLNKKDM